VILDDARAERVSVDPYIGSHHAFCSVSSALEPRQTHRGPLSREQPRPHVFATGRVAVMKVLASLAAISPRILVCIATLPTRGEDSGGGRRQLIVEDRTLGLDGTILEAI